MAIRLCVVLGLAGCFGASPSKGGGKISASQAAAARERAKSPYAIELQPGYRIELVAEKLAFPTGVAFGERGEIYVSESGYSYGEAIGTPRVVEITPGGSAPREVLRGDGAPWTGLAIDGDALFVAEGGELRMGRIVRYTLRDGRATEPRVLADKLPSLGDHHTNGPALSRDGWVYFGQGTATNSAIVGEDNAQFGWLKRHPTFHDTPCQDVTLAGLNFTKQDITTGAYLPYGTASTPNQLIHGGVPCNGAVMRVRADGSGGIELVAWGFRNPFGLAFAPDGTLFVTDNGYDVRGARPVFGAADMLWRVQPGRWYGWPDYSEGRPLTASFYSESDGKPGGFVLARHPDRPPDPVAYFPVHSSADGIDFDRRGVAYVALFGDMAPTAGKVLHPVGFEVVRVDPRTGFIEEFARNRGDRPSPASKKQARGFERPVAVRFDRAGALYVVDFGVVRMTDQGAKPEPNSGALWRISREEPDAR